MTPDVATFLLGILGQVTLNAGADDFDQVAVLVMRARAELAVVASGADVPTKALPALGEVPSSDPKDWPPA